MRTTATAATTAVTTARWTTRRTRWRQAGSALAGLVLTATVVAGCASAGDGAPAASNRTSASSATSARQAVIAAYATTARAGTAKVSFSLNVRGLGSIAPGGLDATGSGAVDLAHRAGQLSVTVSPPRAEVELRYLDRKAYIELPTDRVDHGKRWIELDPDTTAPTGPQPALDGLAALQNIRLADLLGDLADATGQVRDLGTAAVDGVRTTHYRVSIDVSTLVSRLSSQLGPVLRMGASLLGVGTAPVQLWLDDQGRIRRLDTTVRLPGLDSLLQMAGLGTSTVRCVRWPCTPATPSGSGTVASVHVGLTLSDFGAAVHIVAPPAAETTRGFPVTAPAQH